MNVKSENGRCRSVGVTRVWAALILLPREVNVTPEALVHTKLLTPMVLPPKPNLPDTESKGCKGRMEA